MSGAWPERRRDWVGWISRDGDTQQCSAFFNLHIRERCRPPVGVSIHHEPLTTRQTYSFIAETASTPGPSACDLMIGLTTCHNVDGRGVSHKHILVVQGL